MNSNGYSKIQHFMDFYRSLGEVKGLLKDYGYETTAAVSEINRV